jgi:hypothetical protein
MENLYTSNKTISSKTGGVKLTAERVIHASIFILLLIGLTALSLWITFTYLPPQNNLFLEIALVPLSWGIILLAMYLSFNKLGWKWWS